MLNVLVVVFLAETKLPNYALKHERVITIGVVKKQ